MLIHPPISYAVELTYLCRNSCNGCANIWRDKKISLIKWKHLLDILSPPNNRKQYAQLIRVTGGEPTLHPEFYSIIKYIDTFGVDHSLFSSGDWENSSLIIETYKNCAHFIGMLISLHGYTAEMHNKFSGRNGCNFEKICSNIERSSKEGITVFTNTVITKYNYKYISNIVDFSKKLGAKYSVFNRFLGRNNFLMPNEKQLLIALDTIIQLHSIGKPCRIGNCIPPCFHRIDSLGSNAGFEHCAISPLGQVRPDNFSDLVFGNIFYDPIFKIWNGIKANNYRYDISNKCFNCSLLNNCRGGSRSYINGKRIEDPLIKGSIETKNQKVVKLDSTYRPKFIGEMIPFGKLYLIHKYNWSIQVSLDAKIIIDNLNGDMTIEEIVDEFGSNSLKVIRRLDQENFLEYII